MLTPPGAASSGPTCYCLQLPPTRASTAGATPSPAAATMAPLSQRATATWSSLAAFQPVKPTQRRSPPSVNAHFPQPRQAARKTATALYLSSSAQRRTAMPAKAQAQDASQPAPSRSGIRIRTTKTAPLHRRLLHQATRMQPLPEPSRTNKYTPKFILLKGNGISSWRKPRQQ